MGCVSSKLFRKELKQDIMLNNGGDYMNHVVSLTSSTYGVLNLDKEQPLKDSVLAESKKMWSRSPPRENPEVINAWELMEDLEEGMPISNQVKKSPKGRAILRGFADIDSMSPLKFLNQIGSPRKPRRVGGKENKGGVGGGGEVLRVRNSSEKSCKAVLSLSFQAKGSPNGAKRESFGSDSENRRWSKGFSPLFDPELVASYEKELSAEGEQIKRMVSSSPKARKVRRISRDSGSILLSYAENCPPGGENSVVIYTTTLRGIRKTFEDCNKVRSIIESHLIHVFERDISMDSGFKEELRRLMGTKEVKVPLVFVKGRLIGGAEEVVKLEEEGKLGALFDGIPSAVGGCEGCAGFRFVMCTECNGSCKVLDEQQKKMVRCGECNENGLVQCPLCC
ncbi:Thioredoxin-like fold containing protein [Trema orientale]|uniref:Thioredoxin-like fold containing protein n=1 Tax=Trema orientale TaxID=63057 RepID=A0A2P5EC07_TREOI|nr:Thioredoxin-like fold containing protein [Trema orientale]